ncbi:MAG: DNA adenine methylase [Bacilli bacterium]|jgi:DNA adenine methylase|nr:DNA adenine methylase [Bacilli bacterium]MCH4228698.1 DNA adenine methylase [Bacilli bacterium]MCH4278124.1 DNA adenine methylase [Bacilli bacterium]
MRNKETDNQPAPILKWAGGKRQLLNDILPNIPASYGTYYEPFVGGGAVLFAVSPKKAVINDLNRDLIRVYEAVRDNPDELINTLKTYENTAECFYRIRNIDRDAEAFSKLSDVERASRIIFLNKTCYNGLYRVNKSGQFNTPFGSYRNPDIVSETAIRSDHAYFSNNKVRMLSKDFVEAVRGAKEGDFVYFDPPYDPVSPTAAFTDYNSGGFGRKDQTRLANLCIRLTLKGVKIMLSNSATDFIRSLYPEPMFHTHIIQARRAINARGDRRGVVPEVLITNYGQ